MSQYSQRTTRSMSQSSQTNTIPKYIVSDESENDDDDGDDADDNSDLETTTTTKTTTKTTTTKTTTTKTATKKAPAPGTKKTSKKSYPPFTIKNTEAISYNSYLRRPFYGDVRPWSKTDTGFDMNEPCMVGIDEAGRGPVLGPMVYGTCIVPISKVTELKALGVNDSKQLKELDREYLFSLIQGAPYLRWIVDRIGPSCLSSKMLASSKESLNLISHLSALHMVCHYLRVGFNVREVYADTVGPPEKYRDWLEREINIYCRTHNLKNTVDKIVVESKADANYPCVSAASICAKVTRDLDLAKWVCREFVNSPPVTTTEQQAKQQQEDQNDDTTTTLNSQLTQDITPSSTNTNQEQQQPVQNRFGSGYPGDEVTKTWLRNNFDPIFGFPDLVRFSWGTAEKIIDEDGYAVRWGDEEDLPARDASGGGKQMSLMSFIKPTTPSQQQSQWPLMKNNHVTVTTELPF